MTVSSTASAVTYAANGSTTVWPFAFPILADGDAQVIVTDANGLEAVLSPSAYTISGVGDSGGGSVTYPKTGSPLATGNKLTIRRKTAITQPVDLGPGAFYPEVHEGAFDRITLVAQELQEQIERAPKVPIGSGDDPNALLAGAAAAAAASAQAAQAAATTAAVKTSGAIIAAKAAQKAAASAQALVDVTIDPDPALSANSDKRLPPQSAVRAYVGAAVSDANAAAQAAAQAAALAAALASVPVGVVVSFAGTAAPSGWLPCNGAAISRTAYAALFAVIGVAHGAGDGATTFNLPDLRGRVSIGVGLGSGLTERTLGQKLGEENHLLTISEMPSHHHTSSNVTNGGIYGAYYGETSVCAGYTGGHRTSDVGGSAAHNTMQPSYGLNFVIKY